MKLPEPSSARPALTRFLGTRRISPLLLIFVCALALFSLCSLPSTQRSALQNYASGSRRFQSVPQDLKIQHGVFEDWPDTRHPLALDSSLEERLESWAAVPVATAAEWHQFNIQTCPPHQNREHPMFFPKRCSDLQVHNRQHSS